MTDAKTLAKQQRRAERERALADAIAKAQAGLAKEASRFAVILADPPWRFEPYSRITGMDRAADNHYPTATLAQIKALVPPASRDAVLFLWTTNPMLPDALDVIAAWGFTYKTNVVWVKPKIGTGYWVRGKHELLLIGTRGHIPAPAPGTQWPSVIEAPTRGHSVKPEDLYRMIEDYFPNLPKLEMFARRTRPGWVCWGAEAPEEEPAIAMGPGIATELEIVVAEKAPAPPSGPEGEANHELIDDIRANGMLQPITLYEHCILDGRCRHRTAQDLGI